MKLKLPQKGHRFVYNSQLFSEVGDQDVLKHVLSKNDLTFVRKSK